MRPDHEIKDAARLLDFAKSKRLLQFSSYESLGEITSLLYRIVVLADKNMPIKAYLDVVRQMQNAARQEQVLTGIDLIEQNIKNTPALLEQQQPLGGLFDECRIIMSDVNRTLPDKVKALQTKIMIFPAIESEMLAVTSALRPLAFEDEFMLAVAFLDLEVGKLGAITYLKGESPDYVETKKKRKPVDTRDETVLKNLSSSLTRPNNQRGGVEVAMLDSSQQRFGKLIALNAAVPEVANRLNNGATKLDILRDVKIGFFQDKLTLTDYDTICRMARRAKLITFRNRKKDPENSYELRDAHHRKVKDVATKRGITPKRALNQILDDFFALTEKQSEFGQAKI